MRLGFVGLGTMGARIAGNLLQAGYPLAVCDRDPRAVRALEAAGASAAGSPRAVAEQSDIVLLSLPDAPDVVEVATGAGGLVEGAHDGLVILDHSTVGPMTARTLSERLAPLGVDWLDAPVSGGPKGAAAATLTIMVGGRQAAFERCRPVLAAIGRRLEYLGPSGAGATAKIVNQLVVGIATMGAFEAFTLGVAAGIDAARLHQVLRTSSAGSWVLENLIPAVLLANRQREEPAPWFALRLQHKDMRIAVETASALKVPLAAGALSAQLYAVAEGLGWGNRDQVGAVGLYADAAGIKRWRDRETAGEPAPPLASDAQTMAISGRG